MNLDVLPALDDMSAEIAVLGSLMMEPACVDELLEMLRPEDFADTRYRAASEARARRKDISGVDISCPARRRDSGLVGTLLVN